MRVLLKGTSFKDVVRFVAAVEIHNVDDGHIILDFMNVSALSSLPMHFYGGHEL